MAHPAVNALSSHASCVLMVQRVRPHINGVSWMLFKSGILMHAGSLQLLLLLMLLLRRTFEACRSSDVKQLQTSLRGTWPVQRQQNGHYAHKPCSSCIVQHLPREMSAAECSACDTPGSSSEATHTLFPHATQAEASDIHVWRMCTA